MSLRYKVKAIEERPTLYIGARMALIHTTIITGAKGEKIIRGGLPAVTGIAGGPNNFKSAFLIYLLGYGADKINATNEATIEINDTESTLLPSRLESLTKDMIFLPDDTFDPITPLWNITNNVTYSGDSWIAHMRSRVEAKAKITEAVATWTADGIKRYVPTFYGVDTLSKLSSARSDDMLNKAVVEDNSTAMYFMQLGLMKSKLLNSLPRLAGLTDNRYVLTAHLGKNNEMVSGPFQQPTKKLSYLSSDKKIRGVPTEFFELPNVVYELKNGRKFINQATKMPDYPKGEDSNGVDLHIVKLCVLRNKGGVTGAEFPLYFSQYEGLLEDLTNFLFLREKFVGHEQDYGITGNPRSFNVVFRPDISLRKSIVRTKLRDDHRLRRAVELLADLRQAVVFRPELIEGIYMAPEELYQKIADLGYDWDDLLDTRPWEAIDQYSKKLKPYMSFIDLLEFANEIKKPYWHKGK